MAVTIESFNGFIPYDRLTIRDHLKHGGYGTVYPAELEDFGTVVYQKLLEPVEDTGRDTKENRLTSLKHRNIVEVIGIVSDPEHHGLVWKVSDNVHMFEYLQQHDEIHWIQKLQMICDVAVGMHYLHSQQPPIIHGDLKIHNVLIENNDLTAKVCGFGSSSWRDSWSNLKESVGFETMTHIPPEHWKNPHLDEKETFDIYGFGVFMFEALTQKKPFDGVPNHLICTIVSRGDRPHLDLTSGYVSRRSIKLMEKCWNQNVKDRPTFAEIKRELDSEKSELQEIMDKKIDKVDYWFSSFSNEEIKERIRQRYTSIVTRLDKTGDILEKLFQERIITASQKKQFEGFPDQLLMFLFNSSHPRAFVIFREALLDMEQQYASMVHEIDQAETREDFSNEEIKKRVKQSYELIAAEFDPKGYVLYKLFEGEIINSKEMSEVDILPDKESRTDKLLSLLLSETRPRAFVMFKEALTKDYKQIIEMIDRTDVKEASRTTRRSESCIQEQKSGEPETSLSNEEIKKRVKKYSSKIAAGLDPKGYVLNKLFLENIITAKQKNLLGTSSDQKVRCKMLLSALFNGKRPEAFVVFREALQESDENKWVINLIDESKKRFYIKWLLFK